MKELPRGYWGLNIDHIIQKGDIHGSRKETLKITSPDELTFCLGTGTGYCCPSSRRRVANVLARSRVDEGGLCDRLLGLEGRRLWSWMYATGESNVRVSDGPPCKCAYQTIHPL